MRTLILIYFCIKFLYISISAYCDFVKFIILDPIIHPLFGEEFGMKHMTTLNLE